MIAVTHPKKDFLLQWCTIIHWSKCLLVYNFIMKCSQEGLEIVEKSHQMLLSFSCMNPDFVCLPAIATLCVCVFYSSHGLCQMFYKASRHSSSGDIGVYIYQTRTSSACISELQIKIAFAIHEVDTLIPSWSSKLFCWKCARKQKIFTSFEKS